MTSSDFRPPRLSRWLLYRRIPADEREFVMGDLAEEYAERAARDRRHADRWYRRQLRLALTSRKSSNDRRVAQPRLAEALGRALVTTWQDLRYAARSLTASPTFTVVAALTMALGIGVTTAIFALVDAILIQPLPFTDPERIVVLRHNFVDGRPGEWNSSFLGYLDYQALNSSFEELAAWQEQDPSLSADDGGPAIRVRATGITWNLTRALGVEPELGRGFVPEEDAVGAGTPVALLSHALWQDRFGADPDVLGEQIRLDGTAHTIVGVMPRSFTGAIGGNVLPVGPTDVWMPYRNSSAGEGIEVRGLRGTSVIGKLAEGVTLEQAQQDVSAIAAGLAERYPGVNATEGATLRYAHEAVVGEVRPTLWTLFGAVSLVLLIACANVANLLLGRTATRRREVAVRLALGAGRGRLIRQMLAESALLGCLGGILASAVAWGLVEANRSMMGASLPRLETVVIGGRTFLFAALASVGAGLLLGIIPAIHGTRGHLQSSLNSGDRAGGQRTSNSLRQSLVVAEIAMSVMLLFGAGLLIRSFDRALRVDPGFDADNVLTARIRMPISFVDTENWPRSVAFFEEAIERLEALPGVEAATAAFQLPTDGGWSNTFTFVGRPQPPDGNYPSAIFRPVMPGYFELAGIDLLRGRTFTDADHAEAPRVVIANQAFVDEFFADGEDPIGKQLDYGNWWAGGPPEYEIVGVVDNVRFSGRTEDGYRATYFPHAQQPVREMSLLLRTSVPPLQLAAALRTEIAAIDAELPVDNISTLDAHLAGAEVVRRGVAAMSGFFAVSALLLAAIGVYGVMNVAVAQRTREFGIRMALGAQASGVRGMVFGRGVMLTAAGTLLGLAGAAAVARLIDGMLFQVAPTDPVTLATVVAFLAGVALVASWLPARRATRVDPMIALRSE